jgi:hypothetical protein
MGLMAGPSASSRKRPRWLRPEDERFLGRAFLAGFISILVIFLVFKGLDVRRTGVWFSREDVCFDVMMVSVVLVFFIGLIMVRRLERLYAQSYTYSWKGRFDEIETKVLTALDMQGLEHVTHPIGWTESMRRRLFKTMVVVHHVPSMGFQVRMENSLEREDDPTDDSCIIHAGPIKDATHPAIFHFIEAFNGLFDDEEMPKLVVWGRRTRRQLTGPNGDGEAKGEGG